MNQRDRQGLVYPEPKSVRMDFLSHIVSSYFLSTFFANVIPSQKLCLPCCGSLLLAGRFLLCANRFLLGRGLCRSSIFFADHRCQVLLVLRALFRQHNFHVRDAALVAERAAHRRRTDTLHARAFIGDGMLHVEPVQVNVHAFFLAQVVRVLHRGAQQLKNRRSNALLGKGERGQRVFHAPAFNQVQHQPRLLRRYSGESGFCCKFHVVNLCSQSLLFRGGADDAAGAIAPGPPGTPAGLAETSAAAFIE